MPGSRYTDKQFIDALKRTKGMVYVAADLIGCSPNTLKARLEKSATLRQAQEDARGLQIDTTELKLVQAIQAGEPWAIQFYLRTQGKERGYAAADVNLSGDVTVTIRYADSSTDAQH